MSEPTLEDLLSVDTLTGLVRRFADQSENRTCTALFKRAKRLRPEGRAVKWEEVANSSKPLLENLCKLACENNSSKFAGQAAIRSLQQTQSLTAFGFLSALNPTVKFKIGSAGA